MVISDGGRTNEAGNLIQNKIDDIKSSIVDKQRKLKNEELYRLATAEDRVTCFKACRLLRVMPYDSRIDRMVEYIHESMDSGASKALALEYAIWKEAEWCNVLDRNKVKRVVARIGRYKTNPILVWFAKMNHSKPRLAKLVLFACGVGAGLVVLTLAELLTDNSPLAIFVAWLAIMVSSWKFVQYSDL